MNLKVLEVVKSEVTTYNHMNKSELEHENESIMAKMNHKQCAKPRYFCVGGCAQNSNYFMYTYNCITDNSTLS